MTFKPRAAIAAIVLLVSSCGGGDSSGSGGTTLPPMTTTPTPTPPPTPSPSYSTYSDPLSDWRAGPPFALTQVTGISGTGIYSKLDASIQPVMVEVAFAGRPSITANFADFARGKFSNFSAEDNLFQGERGISLNKRNPDFSTTSLGVWYPKDDNYTYQYVALPNVRHSYASGSGVPKEYIELTYNFVIGSRTAGSDLPTPIDETFYSTMMNLNSLINNDTIPNQITGHLFLSKTGALSGKFPFSARLPSGEDRTFLALITGSMDQQTHRISGDITAENGTYVGKFEGYLYGPKGKELAFIVYIKNAEGTIATSGTIIGHQ
ncbi:hypothetical protein [Sphingobium sp. B8D3A]|nr:hypothetical protein [Sphingobium sp. B8D3A]MCW2413465.1 hypothetical protein [Sphingobium sp. B8D3D]MCW2414236.1 hypothetical protein [Sphingobium sp. B8D3A]